jgi:hypothetical protein
MATIPTSGDLFISGHANAKPFDWFLQTSDYFPQILGSFPPSANNVTIQIWNVTDAQNIEMSLSNSDCYSIGDTGRWGWSTSGMPSSQGFSEHYFYMMTSSIGETFDGQFILDVPADATWIHPGSRVDYIKSV